MAGTELTSPPALSTPAEHLFEHVAPPAAAEEGVSLGLSAGELAEVYEIARTAREIVRGGWRRVALQFPDAMLRDAPAVVAALGEELEKVERAGVGAVEDAPEGAAAAVALGGGDSTGEVAAKSKDPPDLGASATTQPRKIYILADTSYSSCCVDEIAAEHVDAEVVIHYGRACLSPTSRLPVIYVFTKHELDYDAVVQAFETEFPERGTKVVLMADVTYQDHVPALASRLRDRGYRELLSTAIVHDPTGSIPNRIILDRDGNDTTSKGSPGLDLKEYDIFHISSPPTALLLALSSRVKSLCIFPTTSPPSSTTTTHSPAATARALLGRRYARVLTLATAGVIGILVNTLSVSNYLASIAGLRERIAAAGKKSYTVVVGKLNAAKLANFAEVDGWVVVGCWESGLVDDVDFYRPVVTPFELRVALAGDERRVWTGEWWGGIEGLGQDGAAETDAESGRKGKEVDPVRQDEEKGEKLEGPVASGGPIEEEESEPPEFDLRTGKLVSNSRPMRVVSPNTGQSGSLGETHPKAVSDALALRLRSDLAVVSGVVSPGAQFLRSQRTWTGLGSDFDADAAERSAAIEEGRSGVARGYTVGIGENVERR